jgi:hypothetical protein
MRIKYLVIAAVGALSACNLLGQEVSPHETAVSIPQSPQPAGPDSEVVLGKPVQWDSPKYPKRALEKGCKVRLCSSLQLAKMEE